MLESGETRKILDFAKKHLALHQSEEQAQAGELPNIYFKARAGRGRKGDGPKLRGVYVQETPPEQLDQALVDHVVEVWEQDGGEDGKVVLYCYRVGETSSAGRLPIQITTARNRFNMLNRGAASQISAVSESTRPFEAAAAVAVLETNNLLRGQSHDFASMLLERDRTIDGLREEVFKLRGDITAAEVMTQMLMQGDKIRAVDRAFDRLDPHLGQLVPLAPNVVQILQTLAVGWSGRWNGSVSKCPSEPGAAITWHIENLEGAMFAAGSALQQHERYITKAHRARLERLMQMALKVAMETDDDDESVPGGHTMGDA